MSSQFLGLGTAFLLSACTFSSPDSGESLTNVSGTVLDGYILGAQVYLDGNGNNLLDLWEDRATTDNSGYYTTSASGTDYCADLSNEDNLIYCLQTYANSEETIIRARDGFDLATGEMFYGSMSRRFTLTTDSSDTALNITPLTTLLTHMTSTEQESFAATEGVTLAELNSDILEISDTGTTTTQNQLIKTALQAHKVIDVLGAALEQRYSIPDPKGFHRDVSEYLYSALADTLLTEANTLDSVLCNSTNIDTIVAAAETQLLTIDSTLTAGSALSSNLSSGATTLCNTIDTSFNTTAALSAAEVKARMRATEIITLKQRNDPDDASIDEAIALAAVSDFVTALQSDDIDLAGLAAAITDGTGTDAATIATLIGNNTVTDYLPTNLNNTRLVLTEAGAGTGAMVMYFTDTVGSNGTLTTCMRFEDYDNALMPGSFNRLNDYTINVVMTVLPGFTESYVLKSLSVDPVTGQRTLSFNFGGDVSTWETTEDFAAFSETLPTDSTGCASVLSGL